MTTLQSPNPTPIDLTVGYTPTGGNFSLKSQVTNVDEYRDAVMALIEQGLLPTSDPLPYVSIEFGRNKSGVSYTIKVGNAPDVDTAIKMIVDADQRVQVYAQSGTTPPDPETTGKEDVIKTES